MRYIQGFLTACVALLLIMIFYSYWSGNNLDSWLKGWLVVCIILYVIRLYLKYRGNKDEK